jgi:hypothetical protein
MSPYDISKLPFSLKEVLEKLGWQQKVIEKHHERDSYMSWIENSWYNSKEVFIINENDISVGLAFELKSIGESLCKLK